MSLMIWLHNCAMFFLLITTTCEEGVKMKEIIEKFDMEKVIEECESLTK